MKRTDQIAGAVAFLMGIYAISQAVGLPYTVQFGRPGAGFFPLWLGLALAALGVVLAVNATMQPVAGAQSVAPISLRRLRKPGLVLLSMLVATLALGTLGFLVTIGLFLAALLVVVEKVKPVPGLITAVAGAASFYVVFEVWLKIQLPIGILGL